MSATENTAFSKLQAEKTSRTWSRGCVWCIIIEAIALGGTGVLLGTSGNYLFAYNLSICILGIGAWLALSVFLLSLVVNRRSLVRTARELDVEFEAKNRLETVVELRHRQHPYKQAQEADTETFFGSCKTANWMVLRYVFFILIFLETGTGVGLWRYAEARFYSGVIDRENKMREKMLAKEELKQNEAKKQRRKEKEEAIKNELARLKLTAPDSEIQKRPLDEIEWQAAAQSFHGFNELKLIVYKNGKKAYEYKLDKLKPGKRKFSGLMALDEFDSMPYDLVSYYLQGKAKINGHDVEVLSMPQFIEVKPLREDAVKLDGGENAYPGAMPSNVIITLLNLQVMLHKTTFRARIARRMQPGKDQTKELNMICNEQIFLYEKLQYILDKGYLVCDDGSVFELRGFPAGAVSCLERAAKYMKGASSDLKSILGSRFVRKEVAK